MVQLLEVNLVDGGEAGAEEDLLAASLVVGFDYGPGVGEGPLIEMFVQVAVELVAHHMAFDVAVLQQARDDEPLDERVETERIAVVGILGPALVFRSLGLHLLHSDGVFGQNDSGIIGIHGVLLAQKSVFGGMDCRFCLVFSVYYIIAYFWYFVKF